MCIGLPGTRPAMFGAGVLALYLAAGAAGADAPSVAVEDILPTPEDQLSARPGADGLIRNGDESTVERVFVYVDGCPMMELVRPEPGTGAPQMLMLPADRDACTPTRGAAAGVAPGVLDGTAGLAEDTGLHVRLFREQSSTAPRTDVERLTSPEGQSLIIDISSVDPMAIAIMARGGSGPAGPGGTDSFVIPAVIDGSTEGGQGGRSGATTATLLAGGSGVSGGGGGATLTRVSALDPAGRGGNARRSGPLAGNSAGSVPVPNVPLPAGLGLLAGAIAVLGLVSRRLRRRPRGALTALRGGASVSV